MKLRFELLRGLPGPLPLACQLPDHYSLEVRSGREACQHCDGRLRRARTSTHHPVGLMLGRPQVRLIHQQCTGCGQADSHEVYRQQVPIGGNYAYDLMVEVGLSRFRDHRQDAEIQNEMYGRWGLWLPVSSIGMLAHSFLDGLGAVHQARASALRRRLAEDGGYALHVDGTCEAGTDVLFAALAGPRGWVLEAGKMTTENTPAISKVVRRCVERFGEPLAVMRDLSTNIKNAIQEVLPETLDLICHYHFLENVGTKLCEKPHAKLTTALRRLKIRPALTSLRKDLVRWSRKGERLSATQISHLLSHPEQIADLDAVALRRFVAYVLLRWLDDFGADLRGEYFPFDLPSLAFYRRGRQLGDLVGQLVALPEFPQRELSTLKTMARHLASLREDAEVVAAAQRLEKAAAMFEELRKVLRLSSQPHERLLRGRSPTESPEVAQKMKERLEQWRDRLRQRNTRERDADKRADQETVLGYLHKYEKELVGHVIKLQGREQPFVVSRTNNLAEHRFGSTKRGVRRKIGVNKLTRYVQAMRSEELLVANLSDPEYVDLVCDGSLANLPAVIAKYWDLAQAIRAERLQSKTDHPMPTSKKQLRNPQLLDSLKQTVMNIVQTVSGKLQPSQTA